MKQEISFLTRKALSVINRDGFSLVEAILSSALFAIFATLFVGFYLYGEEATVLAGNRVRAAMLAEEGLEVVRNIRDAGFENLVDSTPTHGLALSGNQWIFSGLSDTNDIFTRKITIAPQDTKRKTIISEVSWQQNPQRTGLVSFVSTLTNWIASGFGDWSNPSQEVSKNLLGNDNGVKIQTQGNYIYLIRAGGSPNFFVYDVVNPATPLLVGSLNIAGSPKNLFLYGNYAYVVSDDNAQELQIIDISNPVNPNKTGFYNADGNANAFGVYTSGNFVYFVRESSTRDEFIIVDVSIPASPQFIGSMDLASAGYEVVVFGSYAFVASGNNSKELQIINISNPSAPSLIGSRNLLGSTDALTIANNGATLFIGQTNILYIIDASNPSSPVLSGSLNVVNNVNDIALNLGNANNYLFIATSDNANEFKVLDVSNKTTPLLLGQFNISGNNQLMGIAYQETLDRVFAVSESNSEELIVIRPQ